MGGAEAMARLTGSRAYERFTAAQIQKIYRHSPECYAQTARISLLSSFLSSLFLGAFAPIDTSDASGMNLLDLETRTWHRTLLEATAPHLAAKLAAPVPAYRVLGCVNAFFCERYGFAPHCEVVAASGDNPNSLAGLQLGAHDVAVSLGTSDTVCIIQIVSVPP